jgi:hypothetical protein
MLPSNDKRLFRVALFAGTEITLKTALVKEFP